MKQNILTPLPVGNLIQNKDTPPRADRFERYIIPYYQRGYRWDNINVKALLEDIDNFLAEESGKYCLQPVVVVPAVDEESHRIWEVVDGQQRLITLFIIFKVLGKRKYKLIFEKRAKSTDFLENLSKETYSDENPDFHFMSQAHKIISDWFEEKIQNDVSYDDDFYSQLTKKVEVIWYQVEELSKLERTENRQEIEDKKIDIFNRLNIGKIPLSDAELIRALLLSKIKHGLTDREAIMRQAEISNEWYEMEQTLRNEEFWKFLTDRPLKETSSTIELIFNLIARGNSTKYSTYLWFEREIKNSDANIERDNVDALWKKTKQIFHKLKYWFNDITLYHHLGFLLAFEGVKIEKLLHILDNSDQPKDEFKDWSIAEVKKQMQNVVLEDLNYESKPAESHKVFLLHNILTTEKLQQHQNNRFPFSLFKNVNKNGGWSLEHVHAQQSAEMKEQGSMKRWLEDTLRAIENITHIEKSVEAEDDDKETQFSSQSITVSESLKTDLKKLLGSSKIDETDFNHLKNEVIQLFDSKSIHGIDNLALLPGRVNSALNNAIFPVKRQRLIEFQKEGVYVPISTMNVFMKYYSIADLQPYYWSSSDKSDYYKEIKETLAPYLSH